MDELRWRAMLVGEAVRSAETLQRIDEHATHERLWKPLPFLGRSTEKGAEVIALDVLHHEEVPVARTVTDVERGHDVHVTDPGGEACLVEEHGNELLLVRQVRMQDLDCDEPFEARNALRACDVHGGHSARSQLRQDFVAAELPTCHRSGHAFAACCAGGCVHQKRPLIVKAPPFLVTPIEGSMRLEAASRDSPFQLVNTPRTAVPTAIPAVTPIKMLVRRSF